MKQYEAIVVEFISIEATDVIRTSGNDPYLPEPTEWK